MSKRSEEAAFKAYPFIDGEMSKTQNANAGRMYARNIFKKAYEQAEKEFLEQEDGHWQKVTEKAVEWLKNNLRQSEHDNTKVVTDFLTVEDAINSFNDYIK